jgi:hypothetical protein
VNEEAIAVGDKPGHEGFEVAADVGVGVFLDEKGGGGVPDLKCAETVVDFGAREFAFNFVGKFVEAAAVRLNVQFGERLFHVKVCRPRLPQRKLITRGRDRKRRRSINRKTGAQATLSAIDGFEIATSEKIWQMAARSKTQA